MDVTALRPLTIGEILDGSFTLYRRNFLKLYLTQVLIALPSIALGFVQIQDLRELGLASLASALLSFLALPACIWQVGEAALGRSPDIKPALAVGLRRYFPVLAASIAYGFLVVLGFILLIIPGIIIMIMLFAIFQVVTLERNARTCIQRSAALAKGSWMKIFLVMFISGLIVLLPTLAFGVAAYFAPGGAEAFRAGQSPPQSPTTFALQLLVQALTNPFSLSAVTLLYFDQRVRKEGLDIQVASSALDQPAPGAGAPAPNPAAP